MSTVDVFQHRVAALKKNLRKCLKQHKRYFRIIGSVLFLYDFESLKEILNSKKEKKKKLLEYLLKAVYTINYSINPP